MVSPRARFVLMCIGLCMFVWVNSQSYKHQKYLDSIPFYTETQLKFELKRFVYTASGVEAGEIRHWQKYRSYAYVASKVNSINPVVIDDNRLRDIRWERVSSATTRAGTLYCKPPLVAEVTADSSRTRMNVSMRWGDADSVCGRQGLSRKQR